MVVLKNQCKRGTDSLKRRTGTVCRFEEGFGKKDGDGFLEGEGLITQCTL